MLILPSGRGAACCWSARRAIRRESGAAVRAGGIRWRRWSASLVLAYQFLQLPAEPARGRRPSSRGISVAYHWFTYADCVGRPIDGRRRCRFDFLLGLDGISLALDRADDGAHGFLRADFVGIDSRAGGRVLRLPAAARSRA